MENNRYGVISPSLMVPTCSRSVNASSAERSLLLRVISSHLRVLDARDNDSRTLRHKSLLWEQVTQRFNSLSVLPRSRHQIQTLFKNMKAKAKKYQQRLREAQTQEAPHIFPEPDPISEMLLQLLAGEHEHRMLHLKQTALNLSGDLPPLSAPMGDQSQWLQSAAPQEVFVGGGLSTNVRSSSDMEIKAEFVESASCGGVSSDPLSSRRFEWEEEPAPPSNQNLSKGLLVSPEAAYYLEEEENRLEGPSSVSYGGRTSEPLRGEGRPRKEDSSLHDESFTPDSKEFQQHESSSHQRLYSSNPPLIAGMNKICTCSPSFAAQFIDICREEHQLWMLSKREEMKFRAEEHRERMTLLSLQQELCKKKVNISSHNKRLRRDSREDELSSKATTSHGNPVLSSNEAVPETKNCSSHSERELDPLSPGSS